MNKRMNKNILKFSSIKIFTICNKIILELDVESFLLISYSHSQYFGGKVKQCIFL